MKKPTLKPIEKVDLSDMTGRNAEDNTYIQQINDDPISDAISLKAIDELLDKKKLKTISRVKFEQVPILTKLYMYGDVFGDNFTKKLGDLILQLQISTNGLGRRELVQLVQQRNQMEMLEPTKRGSKDIFR